MCNDYERHIAWEAYCRMMQDLALGQPTGETEADLPLAYHVRVRDLAPVMRVDGNTVGLVPMRFGFPPSRPKAAPVFNFRSEGRRFDTSNRCLVPASAFFEFTGTKFPKTRHRFTMPNLPFFAMAAIWREGKGDDPPAFTLLTTDPGPDISPYHDRQIVPLRPNQWSQWLDLSKPESDILRPSEKGTLQVDQPA